ncbi:related to KAR4-transcription factor required for gene regulation in response to pheromones [Sporisorium reilianum f. sp. reilianum]|uniref:Related to KAR4-transcription factor required for gene regulation in response to pheromones n=1 Tax=Sporisorium reilianum f. sp. reilianum TaxID=72559 RepID=A0A2N8UMS8_9BASI|nr:related to KAR4-transcription factor required for gene regulation in response to pheromones [Sporisorium reilianum f. sp. reilianum]
MAVEVRFNKARDHPRWRTLVDVPDQAKTPTAKQQQQHRQRFDQLKRRFGLSTPSNDGAPSNQIAKQTPASHDTKGKSKASSSPSALGPNYSSEEHTLRNDYSQHFVDTGAGQLPGNAVRNPSPSSRFQEYPKLQRLVQLKDALVTRVAHPPTYLQADLRPSLGSFRDPSRSSDQFHLGSLIPVKYDVVLIDPPLEAYEWEASPAASTSASAGTASATWSWEEIATLPVPQLAAKESFVFLWVGSGAGDGLERGREVLAKWGYRRCEDIVCIRTNAQTDRGELDMQQPSSTSAFTRSSQHCLMGIRGTVRRSTDARFVHCNIDTDVILWPGPEQREDPHMLPDMVSKPPELYQTIENFCLGTRRLELFGRNRNLRRGWLTIGLEVGPDAPGWPTEGKVALPATGMPVLEESGSNDQLQAHLERLRIPRPYHKVEYDANFGVDRPGCDLRDRSNLVPYVEEVDQLRPKSPPPRGANDAFVRNSNLRYRTEPQFNDAYQHAISGNAMPSGLSNSPALRGMQTSLHAEHAAVHAHGGANVAHPHTLEYSLPPTLAARVGGGGAGLSGLGAGGARTVSVPSGSDTLSGPQASVLKAKAMAEAAAALSSTSIKPADAVAHSDAIDR